MSVVAMTRSGDAATLFDLDELAEDAPVEVRSARHGSDAGASTAESPAAAGPTLEQIVERAWTGLCGHRIVSCPMCEQPMAPTYGVHARPIGGRCTGCGTELS